MGIQLGIDTCLPALRVRGSARADSQIESTLLMIICPHRQYGGDGGNDPGSQISDACFFCFPGGVPKDQGLHRVKAANKKVSEHNLKLLATLIS